ncbi:hypothetical protein [Halorubrum sp. Atlit-26R]|uniref:DUF7287 family protein n=1 Tax=Halorubrum sp. Atlit-26R TaxID=2282128 RepID=UPI000EF1D6A5|nr:hypothetical protein [Halorubrum sp. Atlit-26R]RLM68606.1 hypothetical protein DVK07_10825 [Halorubrum sp. Atlit-26R]
MTTGSPFPSTGRAQTTVGFIVLVSAFTVAVTLVFGFVGTIDSEAVVDGADTTEQASLTATTLATDVLAANNTTTTQQPHALSHDHVVRFFDPGSDPSISDLPANDTVNIRVTLEHTGGLTAPPAFGGNETLTAGATPPTEDVVSARTKQATLDGRQVTITVKTWP